MKYSQIIVVFFLGLAFSLIPQTVSANILITGLTGPGIYESPAPSLNPGLISFSQSVRNGLSDQLTGVYAQDVLAFPVVQQPKFDAAFVSAAPDTITQFRMASEYQTTGLLAHDYLAGSTFFDLVQGSEIFLVYGDGSSKNYRVYDIQKYQALSPFDPYSSFIDLSTQKRLSAESLFNRIYRLGNDTLVLQTCISSLSSPSWGRLFILARPVDSTETTITWENSHVIQQALIGATVY